MEGLVTRIKYRSSIRTFGRSEYAMHYVLKSLLSSGKKKKTHDGDKRKLATTTTNL